jgi:hypothetical protein
MRAFGCLLVLLLAAVIGLFVYRTALRESTVGGVPPEQQIDTVGVRLDLQAIARAEKMYVITHGRYGTLDELVSERALPFRGENRHGYRYTAQVEGESHFQITATPIDPAKTGWPTLSVDETGQVVQAP